MLVYQRVYLVIYDPWGSQQGKNTDDLYHFVRTDLLRWFDGKEKMLIASSVIFVHPAVDLTVFMPSCQECLTNICLGISAACQHPSRFKSSKGIWQLDLEYESTFAELYIVLQNLSMFKIEMENDGKCPTLDATWCDLSTAQNRRKHTCWTQRQTWFVFVWGKLVQQFLPIQIFQKNSTHIQSRPF